MQVRQTALWGLLITVLIALISSCGAFEDPSKRATQNAQNTALWTRVYDLETQQATIAALRLTAESANNLATQLANVNAQVNILRATQNAQEVVRNATPFATAIGGGVPAGALPSPSPLPGTTTSYVQTTTAASTDREGCATQPQNVFTPQTTSLYFVTRALNVQPNTAYSLRVTSAGRSLAADPDFWVSDQAYDNTCIWYNIDQEMLPFVPGTYTVELLANNVLVAQATYVISAGESTSSTPDAMQEG